MTDKKESTPFSDFIRNASSEEKAEVYGKVLDGVKKRQEQAYKPNGSNECEED